MRMEKLDEQSDGWEEEEAHTESSEGPCGEISQLQELEREATSDRPARNRRPQGRKAEEAEDVELVEPKELPDDVSTR